MENTEKSPNAIAEKKIIPIQNSSNIEGYHYNAELLQFIVQFRGNTFYLYTGVPQEIVDEFAASISKGAFLAVKVKGKYPCTKLVDTSEKVENKACD